MLWILWSLFITSSLIVALAVLLFLYWRDRRALDPDLVALMPAPTVVAESILDPFEAANPRDFEAGIGVVYATDRSPAGSEDDARFYTHERGELVRAGVAQVAIGGGITDWEELRRISVSGTRDRDYLLKVTAIEELGTLEGSALPASTGELQANPRDFLEMLQRKLNQSKKKEIFVYVHGYKVVFENPLLMATELWHYLGYDGVMIAYSWPSTPDFLAYGSDLETTGFSAPNFRRFLAFLAEETDAEKIHILGYSAGTRLVMTALNEMALMNEGRDQAELQDRYRLGQVLLVCSDIDRGIFSQQIRNGIWKLPHRLVIYMSRVDETLGMAELVFRRQRIGRLLEDEAFSSDLNQLLRTQDAIELVDVSNAEDVSANNGHAYFHKSPWVSSDVLLLLGQGLLPEKRALVRDDQSPLWRFPENYPQELADAFSDRGQ